MTDPLSAFITGVLLTLLFVAIGYQLFRAGYRHCRTLHDLVGGNAGDRLIQQYEPKPLLFSKVSDTHANDTLLQD